MVDEESTDWPRFRLVPYAAPTGILHGWDAELLQKGAPDGLACEAARELTAIEDPDRGPVVCFGMSGPHVFICLDPQTHQVVDVVVQRGREPTGPHPKVIRAAWLVNSSLDSFIASVRAVTDRFPFDSTVTGADLRGEEDWEVRDDRRFAEWDQAGEELLETLRRIDAAAVANLDGFWHTFLADLGMGNYASEYWLDPPDC